MTSFLFCIFFLFLIMGVPIAISLGVASICTLLVGTHMPLLILPQKLYNGVNSFPYMASRSSSSPATSWQRRKFPSASWPWPSSSWDAFPAVSRT